MEISLINQLENLPYRLPSHGDVPNPLYEQLRVRRTDDMFKELGADAKILIHPNTLKLLGDYLNLLRRFEYFSSPETFSPEAVVYENLSREHLVLRLIARRPLTFYRFDDHYLLRTGEKGNGGFDLIGTKHERPPLVLKNLISYDEMALSSLISVSVPTPFFNNGHRDNYGRPGHESQYPFEGVYAGVVGSRFERERCMEYAHIVITREQNTKENGYGPEAFGRRAEVLRLWARFYGLMHFPVWEEAQQSAQLYVTLPGCMFDAGIYKKRMRMSIEPFLLDADKRAADKSSVTKAYKAYVHVAALGTGAWAIELTLQANLTLQVYADLLREHALLNVGTIDFSWFGDNCDKSLVHHPRITIAFSEHEPAEPVRDDELLVAMYDWNGNAYPGNGYWIGNLNDRAPSAAWCSAISVLQNPNLNPRLRDVGALRVLPVAQASPGWPSRDSRSSLPGTQAQHSPPGNRGRNSSRSSSSRSSSPGTQAQHSPQGNRGRNSSRPPQSATHRTSEPQAAPTVSESQAAPTVSESHAAPQANQGRVGLAALALSGVLAGGYVAQRVRRARSRSPKKKLEAH